MQLFLLFLFLSFIGGAYYWNRKMSPKVTVLFFISLLLVIAYFFFNQI